MTMIIVRRNEFWALKMHLVGYGPLKRKKKEMKSHELELSCQCLYRRWRRLDFRPGFLFILISSGSP